MIIRTRTHGKSSSPRVGGTRWRAGIGALSILFILAGCSGSQTAENPPAQPTRWDEGLNAPATTNADEPQTLREQAHAVLGSPSNDAGVIDGASQASRSRWTILLSRVDTARPELVQQMLDSLRTDFPEIRVTEREGSSFLALGEYLDPQSPKAQADLRRVHAYTATLGERTARPYAEAFIAPPSADNLQGTNPAYDLRNVRSRFGDKALYTLQIAIYGRDGREAPTSEELEAFRRAAEQAVITLRRDGEQAFYYHAPSRSTVTVGVFYEEDHDPNTRPPYESDRLRAVREKHPMNLLNGQGIMEVVRDERGNKVRRPQKSFLVGIPKG